MNCKKCKTEIKPKEFWVDINGEYHCIRYCYCPNCGILTTLSGDPIIINEKNITNENDLLLWAMGNKSDTSIGVNK